jgi:hypothetical protein
VTPVRGKDVYLYHDSTEIRSCLMCCGFVRVTVVLITMNP